MTNTNELADRFEEFELFPDKLFTPIIEGADEEIREKCYDTAKDDVRRPAAGSRRRHGWRRNSMPIIKYGFSANYLISERLVKKSNEDGYLVGSRGSVGSSVVATFLGISEVNPLPAHYLCRIRSASTANGSWTAASRAASICRTRTARSAARR